MGDWVDHKCSCCKSWPLMRAWKYCPFCSTEVPIDVRQNAADAPDQRTNEAMPTKGMLQANEYRDLRCPECGEMLTDHVLVSRHKAGTARGCNESLTGPSLPAPRTDKVTTTERTSPEKCQQWLDRFGSSANAAQHLADLLDLTAKDARASAGVNVALSEAIVSANAETADLIAFVSWIAKHPDVGDSLTAAEREKQFQARARQVLAGNPVDYVIPSSCTHPLECRKTLTAESGEEMGWCRVCGSIDTGVWEHPEYRSNAAPTEKKP